MRHAVLNAQADCQSAQLPTLLPLASPPPYCCAGRDLHSALQVRAAGSRERLFSWGRRGKRVALDIAKVGQAV